jgi:hypothetical protein
MIACRIKINQDSLDPGYVPERGMLGSKLRRRAWTLTSLSRLLFKETRILPGGTAQWPGTCLEGRCLEDESSLCPGWERSRSSSPSHKAWLKSQGVQPGGHPASHVPLEQEIGKSEVPGELGQEAQARWCLSLGQAAASPLWEAYSQSRSTGTVMKEGQLPRDSQRLQKSPG